jgi:trehalose utilization protein
LCRDIPGQKKILAVIVSKSCTGHILETKVLANAAVIIWFGHMPENAIVPRLNKVKLFL